MVSGESSLRAVEERFASNTISTPAPATSVKGLASSRNCLTTASHQYGDASS